MFEKDLVVNQRPAPRRADFEMKRQEDGTFTVHMYLNKLTVHSAAELAKVFQQYNTETVTREEGGL